MRDREHVVDAIGELEGTLDVLARRFEVTLAARAARAPFEDVRAQPVARQLGAVGQIECLAQKRHRRVDRGQLVTADAHPVEDVGALDVRKPILLGEVTSTHEEIERRPELALRHPGPALGQAGTELELARLGRMADVLERFKCFVEPFDQRPATATGTNRQRSTLESPARKQKSPSLDNTRPG